MTTISEGLYVPTDLGKRAHIWHRYVLGQLKGMVCYSRGGENHYHCSATTFEKWIKRWKCVRQELNGDRLRPYTDAVGSES